MALSHSKMASSTKTAIARITTFNSILIILLPIPSSDHAPAGILYAPPEHHSSIVRHIGGWRNLACYLKSVSNWRPCLPTDAGIHIITNLCYHSLLHQSLDCGASTVHIVIIFINIFHSKYRIF